MSGFLHLDGGRLAVSTSPEVIGALVSFLPWSFVCFTLPRSLNWLSHFIACLDSYKTIFLNVWLKMLSVEVAFGQVLLLALVRGLSTLERPETSNASIHQMSADWSQYYPPDSHDPIRLLFWNENCLTQSALAFPIKSYSVGSFLPPFRLSEAAPQS